MSKPSEEIGLANWHQYTHTDNTHTLIRQTDTRLALVSNRGLGDVRIRLYTDPHGMNVRHVSVSGTVEHAKWMAERWLGFAYPPIAGDENNE